MKKLLSIFIIFFAASFLFCEINISRYTITKSKKEYDVTYLKTKDMKIIKTQSQESEDDVHTTQAFSISHKGTEGKLKYTLFTDNGGDPDKLDFDFYVMVMTTAYNATGESIGIEKFSRFRDEDVKKEFNGDFGCTTFLQNPKSNYAEGYKYMIIEFFCQKEKGLLMRSFLFNDLAFVGINNDGTQNADCAMNANYHTFKFIDK